MLVRNYGVSGRDRGRWTASERGRRRLDVGGKRGRSGQAADERREREARSVGLRVRLERRLRVHVERVIAVRVLEARVVVRGRVRVIVIMVVAGGSVLTPRVDVGLIAASVMVRIEARPRQPVRRREER
jgi:hypothetical protein